MNLILSLEITLPILTQLGTYLKSSVFTVILVKNNNCIPLHQKFNSISETEVFFVEMHLREPTPLKT